jgi:uncharacterized protein YggU (UPF0235/DUF167 family)
MSALPWRAHGQGLDIAVRLTPRGGRDAIEGVETLADGRSVLKARVRAAPEKGAANAALETLIAKLLGVPKTAVAVTAGATSRLKGVRVQGDPDALARSLQRLDQA